MHLKSDVITLLRQLSGEKMVFNTWGVYAKCDARPYLTSYTKINSKPMKMPKRAKNSKTHKT